MEEYDNSNAVLWAAATAAADPSECENCDKSADINKDKIEDLWVTAADPQYENLSDDNVRSNVSWSTTSPHVSFLAPDSNSLTFSPPPILGHHQQHFTQKSNTDNNLTYKQTQLNDQHTFETSQNRFYDTD